MLRSVLVSLCLVGCGAPRYSGAPMPGAACTVRGATECATTMSVMICQASCAACSGTWVERACTAECTSGDPKCELAYDVGGPCHPNATIDGGPVGCVEPGDGGVPRSLLKCEAGKVVEETCARACQEGVGGAFCLR